MTYEMVPTDLRSVVEESVTLARSIDEQREIELDLGRADLRVTADAHRLQQVVFNLLSNALRHAPDSERIAVRLRKRGRVAELAVRDWGPGIPRARLATLFDRGDRVSDTRPSDGLGLGLFIAKGIVDAHDGTIDVESRVGKGTTFVVRLPLTEVRRRSVT
jgi:signal transduction histidine kinase